MQAPVITLNDMHKMPFFGFGTYALKGSDGEEAIKYAIEIGYRHLDTAFLYGTEKEVGSAVHEKIKDGKIKREDIFVTTKLSMTMHKKDDVIKSCKQSLENLGLSYVDLYLIHSPVSLKETNESRKLQPSNIDYVETWLGMEECKKQGLARSIGVSNFNSEQLTRLLSNSRIKPVNNQIEVTLNLPQKELIEFCNKHNISVTGYSPLGKPGKYPHIKDAWLDSKVQEIAIKYKKSPAHVSLRFVLQMGAAPIPRSLSKSRIAQNFDIFDFSLTKREMEDLQTVGSGQRLITMEEYKDSQYYPFNILY